ncbi:DUF4232 domain-containing protein [Kitasatospora mediocidica]|uniref:DUF4232 domain-containing protein n=1 Tax=Kitasatospora mediocidica TaxID=58352 RepID=UPI00056299AC|nr:DUF4232 domain-containing protein [Kitasatospora mediocidica]
MTTTSTDKRRRILSLALLATATTLALTACDGPNSPDVTSGSASSAASATAPAAPSGAGSAAPQPSAPTRAATGATAISSSHRPTTAPTAKPTASPGSAADAAADAYAYQHPCAMEQLSLKTVYDAQLGATRRLIEVTDTGSTACGLDHYPLVAIDRSSTINVGNGQAETVQPAVPANLGTAPGYPLHAGRTAYAVVDLDPSHSTAGASRDYDQLSVIASSNLPNADELDTKITEEGTSPGNPYVKSPFLGLYRDTIAAAAVSAAG